MGPDLPDSIIAILDQAKNRMQAMAVGHAFDAFDICVSLRIRPQVIPVLDFTEQFGHTERVTV